jgi:very-short-patch-repair endonuclease
MTSQRQPDPARGGAFATSRLDEAIADLAQAQHGVVARRQLVALGAGVRAIEWRLERCRLHLLHRGVYAVGHRVLTREGRWAAAVLAGGSGALLSHRSAAALWGLRPWSGAHEITVPKKRAVTGLRVRVSRIPDDELATRDGIALTSVHRTLVDLASVLTEDQLARAADRAMTLQLTDPLALDVLLSRHRGRRGIAALRAVEAQGLETRSDLEDRFLAYLRRHGLATPETNVPLALDADWIVADCLWRPARLIVELDSRAWHDARRAFEADRRRDRRVAACLGLRTIRVTWRQLDDAEVARDLRALLASNGGPTPLQGVEMTIGR